MSKLKLQVMKICDKLHKQYHNDMIAWVGDMINFDGLKFSGLTSQQEEISDALVKDHCICVSAGGGIGKSGWEALAILWFLSCHPYAKVPTTAPTGSQLRDVLWAEIALWHSRCKVKDLFILNTDRMFIKGYREWFAVARTVSKDARMLNGTMAGFHAPWMFAVVDEAADVPDPVFTAIEGAMTGENSYVALASNPVSTGGYYYDTINDPDGKGSRYRIFFFDARESPLVSKEYEQGIIARYGKDSPMYIAKVLGQPINELLTVVCPPALFDQYTRENRNHCDGTHVVGIDVGGPHDPSIFCHKHGNSIPRWDRFEGKDSNVLYDEVLKIFHADPKTRFIVDAVGIGAGLYSFLANTNGLDVTPFYGNKKPESSNDKRNKDFQAEFLNNRTMGYEHLQRIIKNLQWTVDPPIDLKKQLANLKFKFSSGEPTKMEAKVDFKKRLNMSPDEADALMMACSIDTFSIKLSYCKPPPTTHHRLLQKPKGPKFSSKYGLFI